MNRRNNESHTGSVVAQDKKDRASRSRDLAASAKNGLRLQNSRIEVIKTEGRTRFGQWNVRTLCDEDKWKTLCSEFERYNIAICSINEMRWCGQGSKRIEGYQIWYSGEERERKRGVGIAVRNELASNVIRFTPTSSRLMLLRLKGNHRNISVISAYAPTNDKCIEEKENFYQQLQEALNAVPRRDLLVILGDFNTKIGSNFDIWGRTLGRHGVGEENESGTLLLQFCKNNNLTISNTQFIQKKCRKVTWRSPDDETENLIDYVITRDKDMRGVAKTRSYRTAEINSDHFLVISELKMKVPKCKRKREPRLAVDELIKSKDLQDRFDMEISNRFGLLEDELGEPEKEFETFKININEAAKKLLGKKRKVPERHTKPQTTKMIDDIREAKIRMENAKTRTSKEVCYEVVRQKRRDLRKALREERENYWHDIADKMEKALNKNDTRQFFKDLEKICGMENGKAIRLEPVRSKDGQKRLVEKMEILERWSRHFEELLNKESECVELDEPVDQQIADVDEELSADIRISEVDVAVSQLKNYKASGVDQIHAEYLRYGGKATVEWLHRVIRSVWLKEEMPEDWRKMIIIPLHKKGSREECSNSRGISLLSVPGKVFTRVVLNRIFGKINMIMRENQCGFRPGRGCQDQIFALRQIIEKSREFAQRLYICFIDFKQAYDSVWREGLWEVLRRYGIP